MAVAAIARFATLDEQSYWYDEAVTVGLHPRWISATCSTGSPTASPRRRSTTLLAWLWAKVFGTGEVGLRSLSALCGTAFVPVVYAIGARAAERPRRPRRRRARRAQPAARLVLAGGARLRMLVLVSRAVVPVLHPAADGRPASAHARALGGRVRARARHALLRRVPGRDRGCLAARHRGQPAADRGRVRRRSPSSSWRMLPLLLHQRSLDLADFIDEIPLGYRIARTPKQFLVGFDAPGEVVSRDRRRRARRARASGSYGAAATTASGARR